jgi:hypothetical protein
VFVSSDYPERVAKKVCAGHAKAVGEMPGEPSSSLKRPYDKVCKALAAEFSGGDKVNQVLATVEATKGKMADNIQVAMSNMESTEALAEKTAEMENQSDMFNKQVGECQRPPLPTLLPAMARLLPSSSVSGGFRAG